MWPFLYQVPASAAALLKHFEQQTGHLSNPDTTCTAHYLLFSTALASCRCV